MSQFRLALLPRRPTATTIVWAVLAVLVFAAGACSGGPLNPTGGQLGAPTTGVTGNPGGAGDPGGSPSGGQPVESGVGRLTINLTDTPFEEAEAVVIRFEEVMAHRTGGGWEEVDFADGADARECDLKKLEGPVDILGADDLPAGKYTQLRLKMVSGVINFDYASEGLDACAPDLVVPEEGLRGTLEVPSGVLHLNHPFTLAVGGETTILLDFDGDKSISKKGGPKDPDPNSPACNGRGNKPGCDEDPDNEDAGVYTVKPVIGVVSVTEAGGGA
jgi:hypothetical protein